VAPQPPTAGASPQPMLGKGPIPTVQGTPVNPFPPQGPPRLGNPQGQIEAPLQPRSLPSSYFPPRLPAFTAGNVPTLASPPPALNEATARMRVQPNQFATRPTPAPPSGPLPVSPEGQAGVPVSRYLEAGSDPSAAPAASAKTQLGRFEKAGSEKLAAHVAADPSSGLTSADVAALAQTAKGKVLLSRASSLTPGSAAMKALVKQVPGAIGK
jgi:hypothetical protein